MTSGLGFLWDSSVCMHVCLSVPHAFSLARFLDWLFCHNLICFVFIFYCILLHYYTLDSCLLSHEKQKGCGCRWEVVWRGTERSRGRKNSNQNIWHKTVFSIKRK